MDDEKDGGPAFPLPITATTAGDIYNAGECGASGMSLRDYFATAALGQILRWEAAEGNDYEQLAENAYMMADAMLKARKL